MLLAGCSTVCTTVAEAAKMWNLVVVCFSVKEKPFDVLLVDFYFSLSFRTALVPLLSLIVSDFRLYLELIRLLLFIIPLVLK